MTWEVIGTLGSGNGGSGVSASVRVTRPDMLIVPNATFTAIPFAEARWDQGTTTPQFDADAQPTHITCRQAGIYAIEANARFGGITGGQNRVVSIKLNGTTELSRGFAPPGAGPPCLLASAQWRLVEGDYLEAVVYQDCGDVLGVGNDAGSSDAYWAELSMTEVAGAAGACGALTVLTVTGDMVIPAAQTLVLVNTASATLTLPSAASAPGGLVVIAPQITSDITVSPAGDDTLIWNWGGGSFYYGSRSQANYPKAFYSNGVATWFGIYG